MSTNALITFIEGQKIKASETNANNNFLLDEIRKQINTLRTEIAKQLEDFQATVSSGSLGVGDIKIAVYDTIPANFLVCDGSSLLIEDYKPLYNKIGGIFGQADDYHFNLPDFRNRVPEGFKDTSEPFGSYQIGKAPNIKAHFGNFDVYSANATGAAKIKTSSHSSTREQWGGSVASVDIDASTISDKYSDDVDRITVNRLKVNFLIKYKD